MYGFSLCLRRGPCTGRASQAREDAELCRCASETCFCSGTPGAMHTDVVLLNLLLWTFGESGQPRPRGQALEPYRHIRSVEQGGRERLGQRLGRSCVITHEGAESWGRVETYRMTRKCRLFPGLRSKPLNLDFRKRDNWVPIKD